MATLATGLLLGPAGNQIISSNNLVNFFEQVRKWYGNNPSLKGQESAVDLKQYDLGLSQKTHAQSFNVYVPFGEARVELPQGVAVPPPSFGSFFNAAGTVTNLATLTGPLGYGMENIIPAGTALPYTIRFENAATADSNVGEVRIVTKLDDDLNPRSFQLGSLRLGDIQIHIPTGRGTFSGDFDFTSSKGFILRVSAGLDVISNTATWLIQAIDPNTGEVVQNRDIGLLPPNKANGVGSAFVSYTILPKTGSATGTEITSAARIIYNTAAPLDTAQVTNIIDGTAPTTILSATPLVAGGSDYLVKWTPTDDAAGSGIKHVTVYVAEDGGDFKIWQQQTTDTSGVYVGRSGHSYEFLALATDNAGNKEQPSLGISAPNDGSAVNLGTLPTVEKTTQPELGAPPLPQPQPSTNQLFLEAKLGIPSATPTTRPSEFSSVLRPFIASSFATGIPNSHANIAPLAIAVLKDGSVLASGGANRGSLYVILTSKASSDLLLPVMLLLDPAQSFTGVPTDATRNASGAYMVDLQDNLPQGVLKAGQSTTAHTITVYNPDALRVEFTPGIYALPYPNQAPIITSAPVLTAYSGQSYNYQVAGNDPDGAVLGYLLYDAPEGMSVNQNTGLITWSPTQQSPVSTDVTLQVYDLRGAHTTQSFTLNVVGGNHKPVFNTPVVSGGIIVSSSSGTVSGGSSANGTVSGANSSLTPSLPPSLTPPLLIKGAEGKSLQIKLSATDSDRNHLIYWADNLPNSAIFDSATGILTWTPGYEAAGTYENVQFTVSDGVEKVTQTATILIAPTNQAPTLIRPANTIVREGEKIRIQLQATDADIIDSISPLPTSDLRLPTSHLTYSSPLLPGGSQLDPRTGLFEWTPAYFQAGEFEIPFTVSDGESITTQTTKITVLNVNAAPVFDNLGAWQIQEGQSVRFRAFALDPDNPGFVPQDRNADGQLTILEGSDPSVTYTVSGLPTGATFDPITAMFAWTPGYANAGIYNVAFTATDDGNGTGATKQTSLVVPITVFNTNRAPAIAEFTNVTLNRGETRDLVLRVSDADNDPLVLQLKTESTGYGIPDFVKFTDNGDGTATLHLTPGVSDGGNYSFTLVAADNGNGGGVNAVQRDEYTFVVSVNAPNDAPKLPFIGNKVAVVGETLKFIVKASDRNQDNLNFNLSNLPAGATLISTPVYGEALFSWTPTLADIGTYPVTIQVKDSGNGNANEILSSQQVFNLVVRTSNTAPILSAIANQTVAEGQTLTLALSSSDADGDTLTYSASNLPPGAVLDAALGILTWTPNLAQAGTYNNIIVTASDGNKSSSQTFAILVNNTNQAPVLAPLPIQTGLENNLVQFTLAAGDIDNDSLIYSAVSPLPTGAAFDPRTGQFTWKPNYEQAGEYILRFAATDAQGASDVRDVTLRIANVNRSPAISVSPHAVALGETLQFTVAGTDPDNNTNLTYSAANLPDGAVLDAVTGRFTWTPNPGQVGDYGVTYAVSDGEKTVTQTSLVRVAIAPSVPTVNFDLTPSFPAVPGQKVIVQTLANGLAAITNLTATVDGRPVTVDSQGRIEITPTTPGRLVVDFTATDADGRVGHNSTVVKVRDTQDLAAPIVAFAPGLDGALVKSITNIIGSISDVNLDSWVLEIADFGENVYRTLASGNGAVSDLTLAQFDPGKLENGFYQLRLRATDISDRTSSTQAIVEVNTGTTKNAYTRTQTDLSFTFSSSLTPSLPPSLTPFSLVRTYSSLNADEVGSFGNGWQLAALDTNIQTNVPLTGRESLGVYEPFRVGTRLYLTTPAGERVGFTFAPQKHTIPGLTYYTPSWVADSGVNYTLSSADAKLTLAGNRFYDLKTGHAYNPGSGEFDGADYTLSSADGTVYHLSSAGGVTEQIGVNGTRLIYSDSGITSDTGETVRFVKDAAGRLTQITAPDGSLVTYSYDTQGNLVSARNLASGQASRYGYSSNLLTLATGTPGTGGEAITYSTTPQVSPVLADLGSAAQFTGKTTNDSVGESDRFTFSLRDSELRSTATGTVLLGVELQGNMALPTLLGLTPVATHLDANGSYALFAVNRAGLNLIELSNTSLTPSLPLSLHSW